MKLTKYVLLVDDSSGPLARLIPRLRELDFLILRVAEPTAVMELVRGFPKLSLVAVHHEDASNVRSLLADIHRAQPGLPLLWHGPEGSLPIEHGAEPLPFESLTAGDIVAHAERLLEQHLYPPDFATFLADAVVTSFASFGTYATNADPFLKASRMQLADLTAVIHFDGAGTAGHLAISASRDAAMHAYARVMGESAPRGDRDLAGLLAECANHVIGRVSSYFEQRGVRLVFDLPFYLAGADSTFWQAPHRPALATEFETAHGRFFSELCMDTLELARPEPMLRMSFEPGAAHD